MKTLLKVLVLLSSVIVLLLCLLVWVGNVSPPKIKQTPLTVGEIKNQSSFFKRNDRGINNVFLSGNDFERGQQYGYWTQDLLFKQEAALLKKINQIIPWAPARYALFFFSMGWFYGLDGYYQQNWQEEMYGVSLYGSQKNLYFATPYTRQLAYHGIHDMGQMMIDQGLILGACTQVAINKKNGWLIGRNFDFEAGRVFDEDKVLKWVFPEKGQAFVSVIFSGMVGVITGINQKGVYVAINAAGSDDFARVGTPSTLIILKALQNAQSAKEAVAILIKTQALITDIFVVTDKGDTLYVVEKTPERVEVMEHKKSTVITNHLEHLNWQNDKTNAIRMMSNTTLIRQQRAKSMLAALAPINEKGLLRILRDKRSVDGAPALFHRASIDALIASHSIIYDSQKGNLFVSKGPSLSQAFIGFDLDQSFKEKRPVPAYDLPADPDLGGKNFYELKHAFKKIEKAKDLALSSHCNQAEDNISNVDSSNFTNNYNYSWAKAEIALCKKDRQLAHQLFKKTLAQQPAYQMEKDYVSEKNYCDTIKLEQTNLT